MSSPKYTSSFNEAYARLNVEQKQAVDLIDGPVMVVAGPGTGKTQILTVRIANILRQTDTNPQNILALTFTEAAASNMRKRLLTIIGEAAYHVRISTFHAFCSSVILDNPEEFPLPHEAAPLTELERFEIISQIIKDNDLSVLKPINDPLYYTKSIISSISELKREGVSLERYELIIQQEQAALNSFKEEMKKTQYRKNERNYLKHIDLLLLYRQYQESLQRVSRYDFDDMIALTDLVFSKNESLLQSYQERFQYILVDEYQDTNGAQNHVVNLLTSFWGDEANIFVVGDINQSIYRFQGASAENVLSFLDIYPKSRIITLEQNYRSTQFILDTAATLIAKNISSPHPALSSPTHLESQSNNGEVVSITHVASSQLETIYIADCIQHLIKSGQSPGNIAVIYRNNSDAIGIADTMSRWNIPYEIEGGANVLKTPIINQLLTLLSVIDGMRYSSEDIDLFTLLNYEWVHIDPLTILKFVRAASKRYISLLDIILEAPKEKTKKNRTPEQSGLFDEETKKISTPSNDDVSHLTLPASHLDSLSNKIISTFTYSNNVNERRIQEFIIKLINLMQKERQETFIHWFEIVINETGFLQYVLDRPTAIEDLNRVNTLFDEIKKLCITDHSCSLKRFLEIIQTMNQHGLAMLEADQPLKREKVRLTTAHRSKGQEWDHVFIMTAIDGKWGNTANRKAISMPEGLIVKSQRLEEEIEALEDERRLFYVALTRARKSLTITVPETIVSSGRSKETIPSIFLTELGDQTEVKIPPDYTGEHQKALLSKLLTVHTTSNSHTLEEEEWLKGLLHNFKLSSTSLSTYLDCHYKFKLSNLLKVPRAKADYLSLGSAVHKALEMLFKKFQVDDVLPPIEYLVDSFETALKSEIMSPTSFTKRLAQGRRLLTMYYSTYKEEFQKPLFCERTFGYGFTRTILDDIELNGKVDRIDWLDKEKNTVKIIDYKTGRARSLNEIEGKTAASNGSYKRQLVFYKLLTQLDHSFTAKAEVFEFDFIEADQQTGKHKKIAVSVTEQEISELKQLIIETMRSIRLLHFERTTNTSICFKCEFNKHCWPEGIPLTSTPLLM